MKQNRKWTGFIAGLMSLMLVFNLFAVRVNAQVTEETLNTIKQIIKKDYVEEVPEEVFNAKSIDELIELLGDPYTKYFSAKEYKEFTDQIDMKFVGIGVYIEMVPEGVEVVSLIEGAPAKAAGIVPGDIIISADGTSLAGMTNEEAVAYIKGVEGTAVKLKIKRGSNIIDIDVVRKEVVTPTVTGSLLNDHIGYIKLESFGTDTSEKFNEVMQSLKKQNVDCYVIDLRDNLGGYMHAALNIAGYFIGDKTAMIVEDKAKTREKLMGYKHNEQIQMPVIFLINKYSASASEILAAAVKDYGKAYFIGTNSYGKGVAQSLYEFSDGSALKTTTMRFLSPLGKTINKVGISPDLEIEEINPLIVAELLLGNSKNTSNNGRYMKMEINNRKFEINLNDIINNDYWDAYEYILGRASQVSVSVSSPKSTSIPEIQMTSPDLEYTLNERVAFNFKTPNYVGKVQYRVMLWDDTSKTYKDLWSTGDRYYAGWKPNGGETFTLGFKVLKPGNYRLKVFAKRAGLQNSKTALKGMNCDSYLGEIPFTVNK